ncbi:MAG TPA: chromate efflux transporter [Candidatus Polarisedimenticolia bacterium]|nr:chromate efflux transporter [Candidatus Polarisedimenticolia bacterium]
MVPDEKNIAHPTFAKALRFWFKLGFISFGGTAGHIAIMHTELVEKKKWISETRFLHALNYCMLLPGPEATELAIYIGWLLHKTLGGIVAGVLFILPSACMIWVLSYVYLMFGHVAWINSIFYGLKPAVLAIVAFAAIRIGKRALKNGLMWVVAGLAFVALYFFKAPFTTIIAGAAIIGLLGQKLRPAKSSLEMANDDLAEKEAGVINDAVDSPAHTKSSWRRTVRVLAVGLVLWWVPVLACVNWLGWNHTLSREGIFFSKAAMVTFGGSYAALQYVSQQGVQHFHWLDAGQMVDGLGLAETTPGPLMIVLQFVGFLGGWQHPGGLPRLLAATVASAITVWATFVPCFLWIFLGAPYIEQLRGNVKLTAALSSVTAAVVGVVLNLAVWFGVNVLFPEAGPAHGVNWFAVAISVIAFVGMFRWKWDIIPVILGAGVAGILYRMAF